MVDSAYSTVEQITTAAPAATVTGYSGVESITTLAAAVSEQTGYSSVVSIKTRGPLVRVRTESGSIPVYVGVRTAAGLVPEWPFPDVTPVVAMAVSNFLPVTPTTTGAAFTFQTNAGVPATRIMEYRKVGDSAWTTFGSPVTRTPDSSGIVSHTAGYTGLTAATSYEARMTLSSAGYTTKVITGADYPSLNFTTAATVVTPPTSTAPKLTYSPPTLVDPLTIEIPTTGGDYKGLNGRDVRWIMPSAPVVNTISVFGGGNHHFIGGETRSDSGGMSFDIEDYAGEVYCEGLVVDPTGLGDQPYPSGALPEYPTVPPFYSDGFRVNSRLAGSRFTLQNSYIRVDGFAKYADGTNGPHGDAIQLYRGPSEMRINKVTVDTYYQGFFLLADQYSGAPLFGPYRFSDIDVWRHASAGGAGAFTLSGPTDVISTNCYARRDPGSNTSLASGPSSSSWQVSDTAPPGGSFCPRLSVGVGYVSPGYL